MHDTMHRHATRCYDTMHRHDSNHVCLATDTTRCIDESALVFSRPLALLTPAVADITE